MHIYEDFVELFRNKHLQKGEIKVIFVTADINEDDKISSQEWNDFHGLFIEPFEELDTIGDYLIDKNAVQMALTTKWF